MVHLNAPGDVVTPYTPGAPTEAPPAAFKKQIQEGFDQGEQIRNMAAHQTDGMGQRPQGKGDLLDMRTGDRLQCRTIKHRAIMGA